MTTRSHSNPRARIVFKTDATCKLATEETKTKKLYRDIAPAAGEKKIQ